jgi:hypothetical protein
MHGTSAHSNNSRSWISIYLLLRVQSNVSTGNDRSSTTVDGEAATTQNGRHQNEAAEAATSAASSSSSSPAPGVAQQRTYYPDIMDIAGMDYSPATRKPPIHN